MTVAMLTSCISEPTIPVVNCGAPDAEAEVKQGITRLTETVRELQQHASKADSKSVKMLLMEAQDELHKLSAELSKHTENEIPSGGYIAACEKVAALPDLSVEEALRRAEEDDVALIKSIPIQGLLGACFAHEEKKQSRPSAERISSVSTMSSLGERSSQTYASSSSRTSCDTQRLQREISSLGVSGARRTPRPTLPCSGDDLTSEPVMRSARSPRPSLPCFNSHDALRVASSSLCSSSYVASSNSCTPLASQPSDRSEFPKFFSAYDYNSRPTKVITGACTHRPAERPVRRLSDVLQISEEEQEDDAWELEFLRRAGSD